MTNSLIYLLFLSLIGSIAGLIGGLILILKDNWAKTLSSISIPLAAGVLLSVSFLDLLPEAVEEIGNSAFITVLFVFIIFFLMERFLFAIHHHIVSNGEHSHHKKPVETAVPLVVIGDTVHNFLDGVAIAASFLISPTLGLIVALSTFLHETPHEIADFGILIKKGWSKSNAFIANFLSAIATIPGALLTYFYANRIEGGVGYLMAISAALFLYVATTDFIPEMGHAKKETALKYSIFLLLGASLILFVGLLVPEGAHGH